MDVVATRIRDLKGDVELESEPGRGTRIILRLPLTLTIVSSLLVTENGQLYAVPLTDLDSTAKVAGRDITPGERGEVWPWMGESIPLYSLAGMLGRERPPLTNTSRWCSATALIEASSWWTSSSRSGKSSSGPWMIC